MSFPGSGPPPQGRWDPRGGAWRWLTLGTRRPASRPGPAPVFWGEVEGKPAGEKSGTVASPTLEPPSGGGGLACPGEARIGQEGGASFSKVGLTPPPASLGGFPRLPLEGFRAPLEPRCGQLELTDAKQLWVLSMADVVMGPPGVLAPLQLGHKGIPQTGGGASRDGSKGQAQQQRDLDGLVGQPLRVGGRRCRREAGANSRLEVKSPTPISEQDSGILDVEEEEEEEEEEVPGAQDLVDFSPVYRCFHIYSVLGARETFESYYRKQRRKQARLVLQPPSNMHETLSGYRKYFHQIVGFFVIEDHILHTSQGLVDRAYIDELWDMALSKTIAALRTHSSYCSDPDLVLDLKNLIVLFADTLQGYGFPVNQLFDLLLEIQDQYSETLLKKWAGAFRNILDLDNYSPISVADEEQYEKMVGQFPFHDAELEKQPFPRKFPFSELVPRVYTQIKEFIYACLKFSEDLHLSSTEVDDMIRKSTNLLLTRTLSSCLQNVIRRKNVGLTELVQIIINTTHLERSCHFLEEFITNITNVLPETVHTTKLYGMATFKDARHAAEEESYTNLNQKIDQFLQLADYDWTAAEPSPKASGYLVDLIAFLRSTFAVFTHLPRGYRNGREEELSAREQGRVAAESGPRQATPSNPAGTVVGLGSCKVPDSRAAVAHPGRSPGVEQEGLPGRPSRAELAPSPPLWEVPLLGDTSVQDAQRLTAEEGSSASLLGLTEASSVWEQGSFRPLWVSHSTFLDVAPVPAAVGRAWTGVSCSRASRQTAKLFRSRFSSLVDPRRAAEQDLGPRSGSPHSGCCGWVHVTAFVRVDGKQSASRSASLLKGPGSWSAWEPLLGFRWREGEQRGPAPLWEAQGIAVARGFPEQNASSPALWESLRGRKEGRKEGGREGRKEGRKEGGEEGRREGGREGGGPLLGEAKSCSAKSAVFFLLLRK
ncbi:exocyst complex component 6B [Crotalus adamanteus]|uniref:Exocyst complex component 6B n=1 Tax=Crotalus adamanteus TaxID=8729 RepID=A0AAW1B8N2_CROAD